MNIEVDARAVVDRLLAHENSLVAEAAKAAYWQAIAERAMAEINEAAKEEKEEEVTDGDPVASDSDKKAV